MLAFFTVLIMLLMGYAYLVEGLFTAMVMCCNVVGAGLIAFNFWEPLANVLEPLFGGHGYEDFLSMILIFSFALGALRTVTNLIASTEVEFPPQIQRPGGALFGLITGYLVSGFLTCALQTLPWHQNFMYFDFNYDPDANPIRKVLPPDRLWLAMMHRAGAGAFSNPGGQTFDPYGTFEQRYARYRRYTDKADPPPYHGEFAPDMFRTPETPTP
jgi:hypothetical protein